LFERVKAKVLEGKFHPVGGSWVENDANMPSGEGLARQFIFGQRFFQSRFGIRCKTAWLPDSFGLTGALPQLIRLAGMDYFFTQKLSWCVSGWNTLYEIIRLRVHRQEQHVRWHNPVMARQLKHSLATFSPTPRLIGSVLMVPKFCAI